MATGIPCCPSEIVEQCVKVHQYCQACATSVSQYAALAAYEGDQSPVTMMRDEYKVRRDLFCKGLAALGFSFPVPEGAFYAFVPMKPYSPGELSKMALLLSLEQHLAKIPRNMPVSATQHPGKT